MYYLDEHHPRRSLFPLIWNFMKPENWLRINLYRDWCLCTALCSHSDACYYWIG